MFLPELKSKIGEDISILIKLDNHSFNYICDCGDASELTVKDCQNTKAIFISHTHIDHFINFDFILRHQIGLGQRVIICGPKGITQQVQSKIRGYQWNLIEENAITYEIREIETEGSVRRSEMIPPKWDIQPLEPRLETGIYSNDRFEVNYVILDHKTDAIAYLFKEKDSVNIDISQSDFKGGAWINQLKIAFQAGQDTLPINIAGTPYPARELYHLLTVKSGDSLGVIMDHAANEANHQKIIDLFLNCSKVFIESFYKSSDKALADANYHSYSVASGTIMKVCNVGTAIPVHFSRRYTEEEVKQLEKEFYGALK